MAEGRAQSRLRHPNIVSVTDVVQADGFPALVMEYIDGPSLAEHLRRGLLPTDEVDHLALGILRGVGAAHRQGVIHRDLKPANILLDTLEGKWVPRVADFGLAKTVSGSTTSSASLTRTGALMGTPAYMAPEQIRDAKGVDHRADIWSLGVILYELVTGALPFRGQDTMELLNAVTSGNYPPPSRRNPELPARMEQAIRAALVPDPGLRVASVDELLALWTGAEAADTSLTPSGSAPKPSGLKSTLMLQASRESSTGSEDTWSSSRFSATSSWPQQETLEPAGGERTPQEGGLDAVVPSHAPAVESPVDDAPPSGSRRWSVLLAASLLVAFMGLGLSLGTKDEPSEIPEDLVQPRDLFAFEVDDTRSMARFADARKALYQGEFPRASTLLSPLVEEHPEQPAPALMLSIIHIFSNHLTGDMFALLDQSRSVPQQGHPSAIFARIAFDEWHSPTGGPVQVLLNEEWRALKGYGYDMLVINALLGSMGISDDEHELHPERVHLDLLKTGAEHTLTHILIADYWLWEFPAPGARAKFDAAVAKGLEVSSDPSYLHYQRGQLHLEAGEYEDAREVLVDVLKGNPSLSLARQSLIEAYVALGDDQRLSEEVERMLGETTSDEQKKSFCLEHGKRLLRRGMLRDAIDMMQCQIELSTAQGAYATAIATQTYIVTATLQLEAWELYQQAIAQLTSLLAEPEIPDETRQGFIVQKLGFETEYLIGTGELARAEILLARLKAIPDSRFAFESKAKRVEELQGLLWVADEQWDVLQEKHPTPVMGCKYLWAYPIASLVLRNRQGTEAAIDYLAQPLPAECSAPSSERYLLYYPPVLSELAALQLSVGRPDEARDTLQKFDALWPRPDANLPTVVQIEEVRRRLERE